MPACSRSPFPILSLSAIFVDFSFLFVCPPSPPPSPAALIATHEKAFGDIKAYYNEITHSNLDLIKTLKDEVDDLRSKEALHERSMFTIAQENKKMSEPMRKAIEEVKRLREERETYQKDLAELAEMKAHVLVVTDKLENLRWEHEILQQRYTNLVQERDKLYDKFQAALHDVKQKSSFRSLLLERRLSAAASEVERQTVTLSEVLMAARLDPRVLGRLERQLADVVASKDTAIREVEGELERVAAAHDRLMEFFDAKLQEYGQFGFPSRGSLGRASVSLAPLTFTRFSFLLPAFSFAISLQASRGQSSASSLCGRTRFCGQQGLQWPRLRQQGQGSPRRRGLRHMHLRQRVARGQGPVQARRCLPRPPVGA